jgi:hypothetical protein
MRARLRRVAIAAIVTFVVVTEIRQGLAEPDPASVVRIELSEYAFSPAQVTVAQAEKFQAQGQNETEELHVSSR